MPCIHSRHTPRFREQSQEAAASLLPFRPTAGKEGAMILDMFRLDDKVAVITGGGAAWEQPSHWLSPRRRGCPHRFTNIIRA